MLNYNRVKFRVMVCTIVIMWHNEQVVNIDAKNRICIFPGIPVTD